MLLCYQKLISPCLLHNRSSIFPSCFLNFLFARFNPSFFCQCVVYFSFPIWTFRPGLSFFLQFKFLTFRSHLHSPLALVIVHCSGFFQVFSFHVFGVLFKFHNFKWTKNLRAFTMYYIYMLPENKRKLLQWAV